MDVFNAGFAEQLAAGWAPEAVAATVVERQDFPGDGLALRQRALAHAPHTHVFGGHWSPLQRGEVSVMLNC